MGYVYFLRCRLQEAILYETDMEEGRSEPGSESASEIKGTYVRILHMLRETPGSVSLATDVHATMLGAVVRGETGSMTKYMCGVIDHWLADEGYASFPSLYRAAVEANLRLGQEMLKAQAAAKQTNDARQVS